MSLHTPTAQQYFVNKLVRHRHASICDLRLQVESELSMYRSSHFPVSHLSSWLQLWQWRSHAETDEVTVSSVTQQSNYAQKQLLLMAVVNSFLRWLPPYLHPVVGSIWKMAASLLYIVLLLSKDDTLTVNAW